MKIDKAEELALAELVVSLSSVETGTRIEAAREILVYVAKVRGLLVGGE